MKKRKDTMLTMMLASTMVANTAIPAYAVTSEDITKDGYTENNAEEGSSVIVDASGEDKEEKTASHVDTKNTDAPGVIAMSSWKGEATANVEGDISVDNSEYNSTANGVVAVSNDEGKSDVSIGGDVSTKGYDSNGVSAVAFGGQSTVSVDGDVISDGEDDSTGVLVVSSKANDMIESRSAGGSDEEEAEGSQGGKSSVTVGGKIESSAMGNAVGIGYIVNEDSSANVKAGQVNVKSEYWDASGISNNGYMLNIPIANDASGDVEIEVDGIEAESGDYAYGIQNKVDGGNTKITVGGNGITAKGDDAAIGYENTVSSGTSDTKVHGDINAESSSFITGIMNEARGSVKEDEYEEIRIERSSGGGEADAENGSNPGSETDSAESSIHVDGDVNIKKTLREFPEKDSILPLNAMTSESEDGEAPSIFEYYPEEIMYRIGNDGAVGIANGAEGGKASAEVDGGVNIESEGGIVGAGVVNGAIDGKADTKVAGDVTVSMKDGYEGERGSSAGIVNVSAAEFSDVAEEIISELTEDERYAEFSGYSEASVNVDGSVKLDGGKKSAGVLNIGVGGKSNVNVGGDVDVDSIVKGVGVANLTTADGDTNTAVAGSVNVTSDLPYGVIINGGTMVIDGSVSVKNNESSDDNEEQYVITDNDENEFSIIRDLNNGAGVLYGNRGDLVIGGDIDASASDKSSAITIVPVVAKQADKGMGMADDFVWQSFVERPEQQPQDDTEESAGGIPSEPIMTMAQQNNESDENADGDLQETASNGQITVLGTIKGNDGNAAIVVNVTKIKQFDNENNSSDANGIIGIAKEFSNMLYNDGEEIRNIDNAEEAFANVPTIVAHALEGEVAVHMDDDEAVSEEEANAAKQIEENIYYIIEYDENLANGKITISKYEKDFSVEMSDGSTKDVYTARQDQVVTITIVPDENYEVDESGLTSNTEAKLVRVGDTNDYELTIPKGGGIHISALFKEIEKEEEPVDPVDPDDKDNKDDENKQDEEDKDDSSNQGGNQGGSQDGKQDDGKQDGDQSGGQDDGNQDGKQNDGSQDGKQDDGGQGGKQNDGSQDGKQDDSKKDDSKQEDKQDQSDEGKQADAGTEENTDKDTDPVKQDTGKKGISGGHSGIRSSGGGSGSGGSGGGGGSRNNANNPNPTYPGSGNNGVANLGLWEYTNDGHWHVKTSAGGNFQDGWLQVDNPYANENQQHRSWFMFKDGNMLTGWVQDKGEWYYLNPTSDNTQGMMMTGWQWINGHCYYLDPASGKMLSNTVTPDGFTVDAEGHWTVNGVPQYREMQTNTQV